MGQPRICVVGSLVMDLTARVGTRPAPGETVIAQEFEIHPGGKGLNQAVAAARSGAHVSMIGRVGTDMFGEEFLALLDSEGIERGDVSSDSERGTGIGMPIVDVDGENAIVVAPRANAGLDVEDIRAAASIIENADVLLLQLEVPISASVAAAQIARAAHTTVVLDPAPADPNAAIALRGLADLLVPNEIEAAALVGACDPASAAERLLRSWRVRGAIVTAGNRGAFIADDSGVVEVPAHHVIACDSTGAGDAFSGALAVRLAAGESLSTAAVYANAAAALAVTRRGAAPSMPTCKEILALLPVGAR